VHQYRSFSNNRYTRSPPTEVALSNARFEHVRVDTVGPLSDCFPKMSGNCHQRRTVFPRVATGGNFDRLVRTFLRTDCWVCMLARITTDRSLRLATCAIKWRCRALPSPFEISYSVKKSLCEQSIPVVASFDGMTQSVHQYRSFSNNRYTRSPPTEVALSNARFEHVRVDTVGPLSDCFPKMSGNCHQRRTVFPRVATGGNFDRLVRTFLRTDCWVCMLARITTDR
ncbi:hypothetical protein M514_18376, partial [Trichuris suis]